MTFTSLKQSQKTSKKFTPADYAQAAVLANEVSKEMLLRLQWMTLQPKTIVEVGCGAGNSTCDLKARYPEATVYSLDIAYPMLQFLRTQANSHELIQADTHQLPLQNGSVDLLVANFLLPWCADVEAVLREWKRVLKPNGLLMFSSLGPDTMLAWRDVLGDLMLPNLIDMHDVGDALLRAKFSDPVLDVDYMTLKFKDAEKMLNELQASEMLVNTMLPCVEQSDVTVDFEIIYGHAWAPEIKVGNFADENGIVKIPLEQLRRKNKDAV